MTDIELLELAAKAAGYTKWERLDGNALEVYRRDGAHFVWNPLADDGDALRLAVQLQLSVHNEHVEAGVVYCTGSDETVYPQCLSGTNEDEVIDADYVATRRAIVLAAAEIGQEMAVRE